LHKVPTYLLSPLALTAAMTRQCVFASTHLRLANGQENYLCWMELELGWGAMEDGFGAYSAAFSATVQLAEDIHVCASGDC
jgi:hypothetical protein